MTIDTLRAPAGAVPFSPLPRPAAPAAILADDAAAIAAARRFAAAIAPGARERDAHRILPVAEVQDFSASGLWSINVPKADGGPGVSYATVAQVFAIIAAADASIAQLAQNHIAIIDLIRFEPDAQKRAFLYGEVLAGLRFGNAVSEKGGKTIFDFKTRIRPTDGGFIVSGEKFYATGAAFAHYVPVLAIADDEKGRIAFIPRDAKGLTVIDDWSGIGQRTTASGTVLIDDVFVPESHVIESWRAAATPSVHGPVTQIIQAAIDAGIARAAFEAAIAFVREKGRPWPDSGVERLTEEPFVIRDIGDLAIHLNAAEAVLEQAGRAIDAGLANETEDTVAEASVAVAEAKILTTEIALAASSRLFELSGTRSALAEHGLDRYWRDARTHTLHDPVRWKFHAIGNYALNGLKPPRHSWL